jgi:predicted transcriptional regulator of viral defense system
VAAIQFITDLVTKGRYSFSSNEAALALGTSPVATRAALRRLRQKGEVAMPYKGFYVVVPPEYRNAGCLPAGHFLPALMEHLGEKYYAGLLSAAEFHGAAHQRPQVFQVVVAKNKPEITCGQIRVSFVARKNMELIPTTDFKTPRGYLKISTPEATAYDLVGYPNHGAGLDNVATVLAELAEKLNGKELVRLAGLSPIAWAQRLGYLLERAGAREKTAALAQYITMQNPPPTPLSPSLPVEGRNRLMPWNLLVNTPVEPDV